MASGCAFDIGCRACPRLLPQRDADQVGCPGWHAAPVERRHCARFLERDLGELCRGGRRRLPVAVLALSHFAHEAVLQSLGLRVGGLPFGHGSAHTLAAGVTLVDSYHCSRYNTRTGRLARPMFDAVFEQLGRLLTVGRP